MSQSAQSTKPVSKQLFSFDANMKKVTDTNKKFLGWQFTIAKKDFPTSELKAGQTYNFTLDAAKYRSSFEQYGRLLNVDVLPESLYSYTVSATTDSITVTGMTETTVRVAIVELINKSNPNTKVMLVRPPVNFRVYELPSLTENNDSVDVYADGMFNMFGTDDDDW